MLSVWCILRCTRDLDSNQNKDDVVERKLEFREASKKSVAGRILIWRQGVKDICNLVTLIHLRDIVCL
jgi:hypothetical protein